MCTDACRSGPHAGSRRRKLWELDHKCLCPIMGTCFELSELRRSAVRWLGMPADATDFEIHLGTIRACGQRTELAERMQADLERRHALTVQAFRKARSAHEVLGLWHEAVARADVAAALWAACTHPRSDEATLQRIYEEVHMLQHQVGTAQRADLVQLRALQQENAVLARELAGAQQRFSGYRIERDTQLERLRTQLCCARAEACGHAAAAAASQAELRALQASAPSGAPAVAALQQQRLAQACAERDALQARLDELALALQDARADLDRAERELATLVAGQADPAAGQPLAVPAAPDIAGRAVACVGGRPGSIDVFRRLVERQGARLLHHDGGQEDAAGRLEPIIAAADAVICQTGCISHGAYWRVKDYCRRTGKRCVFVKTPGVTSFLRGLDALMLP